MVLLLKIGRAFRHPVRFQNEAFIRIGSVKKPLKEAPDRERELWRIFDQTPFEDLIAVERASADEVVRLLPGLSVPTSTCSNNGCRA